MIVCTIVWGFFYEIIGADQAHNSCMLACWACICDISARWGLLVAGAGFVDLTVGTGAMMLAPHHTSLHVSVLCRSNRSAIKQACMINFSAHNHNLALAAGRGM